MEPDNLTGVVSLFLPGPRRRLVGLGTFIDPPGALGSMSFTMGVDVSSGALVGRTAATSLAFEAIHAKYEQRTGVSVALVRTAPSQAKTRTEGEHVQTTRVLPITTTAKIVPTTPIMIII